MTPRVHSPDGDGEDGDSQPEWLLADPGYSRSLQQGLEMLACFTPERPALGISDVADQIGMPRSTVHRYMSTLLALGYLRQDPKRKYRLTLGVTRLGLSTLSSTGLADHARPYLQELANVSAYTASLAVLDGTEILCLDRVQSAHHRPPPGAVDPGPGSRLPLHCTATGKLLLAHLPRTEQTRLLDELTLTRRTPNTIASKRTLQSELKIIVRQGLATDDQELTPGRHAIAVPIRSVGREVIAALGMSAPTATITPENLAQELAPHLLATADRISARLGYRRSSA